MVKCPNCGQKTSGDYCHCCKYPIIEGKSRGLRKAEKQAEIVAQELVKKQAEVEAKEQAKQQAEEARKAREAEELVKKQAEVEAKEQAKRQA
ncbi:hypothetical protein ACFLVH_06665, partial [Chloroflexota bacterium]